MSTLRELVEQLCDCDGRRLNGRARELANEIRESLAEAALRAEMPMPRDEEAEALIEQVYQDLGRVGKVMNATYARIERWRERAETPTRETELGRTAKIMRELSCYADKLWMNLRGQYVLNPENFSKASAQQLLGEWNSLSKRCYEAEQQIVRAAGEPEQAK